VSLAPASSSIALDWPHDPAFRAVGRLVLSGVASRIDLAVDRVEELGLTLDTLARSAVTDGRLRLEIDVAPGRLSMSLGTFTSDPLADRGVRRVVVALVEDVASVADAGGHRVLLTVPGPE
jgi:hypothetical protein